jgi:hypothetical protein
MSRTATGLALVLALALTVTGCQKLSDPWSGGGQLPAATLSRPDAIPSAWGDLVSVSAVSQYPDLLQLWFQDDQKVIRVVVMRPATMALLQARVIHRD